MKDSLVDRPPTIGELRRQGVVALTVRCRRPCKRIGRVTLDALRLPDDTAIAQIPKLRRLRCEACDRCVPDIEPIWPAPLAEPAGGSDTPAARWVLTVEDADGQTGVSSPHWSRQHAARFARQQIAEGGKVSDRDADRDHRRRRGRGVACLVRPTLMARRTSRSDVPTDVPAVLRGLAACRDLMLDVQRQVKPTGACFYGAGMVLAALDGFAAFLTGQRYYLATLENRGFGAPEPVDPETVYDRPRLPAPTTEVGERGDEP